VRKEWREGRREGGRVGGRERRKRAYQHDACHERNHHQLGCAQAEDAV